jgi:hypothetical protein
MLSLVNSGLLRILQRTEQPSNATNHRGTALLHTMNADIMLKRFSIPRDQKLPTVYDLEYRSCLPSSAAKTIDYQLLSCVLARIGPEVGSAILTKVKGRRAIC